MLKKDSITFLRFLIRKKGYIIFFLLGFSFKDTDLSHDSRGGEATIFYSTVPLPAAHEHSDIYFQLYTWDNYYIFLIATLAFTTLLLHSMRLTTLSNYYLINWGCNMLVFVCWFDLRFCYSYFSWETGGLGLASTIIFVLQANRLTKCASHLSYGF